MDRPRFWDEAAVEIDLEAIEDGARAGSASTCRATGDLTAVVALIERGDDGYLVLPRFFVPEDGIRRRSEREGVNYALWAEQEHIVATPGSVVDYGVVEGYVAGLAERFRVEAIAIDRWNSTATTTRLLEAGLPVIRFGQGYARMSPACKEIERLILSRRLAHDGSPVMRWCLGNVAIAQDAGRQRQDRQRPGARKVDGAVALAMAVGVAATEGRHTSVYAERLRFSCVGESPGQVAASLSVGSVSSPFSSPRKSVTAVHPTLSGTTRSSASPICRPSAAAAA